MGERRNVPGEDWCETCGHTEELHKRGPCLHVFGCAAQCEAYVQSRAIEPRRG